MALSSGTKLGPYEIQSLVGAGGMGEVYRAHDSRLDRTVAIKILPASFSADTDRMQRFAQEARAAAALNHPNILSIFDIGDEQGSPYVVSELLEGETLRERLRNGALSVRKAIDYALQVARGLAAAHEKGIVHRDLKPENLFITNDGRVKILDFGLAKLTRPEAVERSRRADRPRGDRTGADHGHGRLHVAGTGARPDGRPALRHLCLRRDSVRDDFRQARLPRRNLGRHHERDPERGAARAF